MSKLLYVLVRIGSEYNDEIEVLGRGSDTLEKAYDSLEAAEAECKKANVEFARNCDSLTYYSYDLDEEEIPDLKNTPAGEVLEFLDKHDLRFYRVDTVKYDV